MVSLLMSMKSPAASTTQTHPHNEYLTETSYNEIACQFHFLNAESSTSISDLQTQRSDPSVAYIHAQTENVGQHWLHSQGS